jgi:glutaredoxin
MLKSNGIIVLAMTTCPHCNNMKRAHEGHGDMVFVDIKALAPMG